MVEPSGLDVAHATNIAGGVLELLRGGSASNDALRWAQVCTGSGRCIPACPEGIDPRAMIKFGRARRAIDNDAPGSRESARNAFRTMARGVRVISRLQLLPDTLSRVRRGEPRADPLSSTCTAI
ncbi:MAG: hypothetical protein AAF493_18520 [Pseudomonadota bacterium]